jgi:PST family polysaccharide transporter
MFRWGVAAGVIYLLAFIIGLRWGIVGVAVAYAITSLMLTYPNFAIPFTLIDLPIRNFSEVLWRPFVACLIMFAGILALKIILPPDLTGNWVLAVLVPVGGLIYLATNWLMNRNQVMELIGIVGGQQ